MRGCAERVIIQTGDKIQLSLLWQPFGEPIGQGVITREKFLLQGIIQSDNEQSCVVFGEFLLFIQQRKIFCSTERTFSPKQLQIASEKDVYLLL